MMKVLSKIRNLPKLKNPTIIEKYFVKDNCISVCDKFYPSTPFEMKRPIIGTNFVFPSEVDLNGTEICYGHSIDSKVGRGFSEIWKHNRGSWKCKSWNSTWMS